jgi:hypothetical protein
MSLQRQKRVIRLLRVGMTNSLSPPCNLPLPIFSLQYMATGSTGTLYVTTSGYVIKLAVEGEDRTLEKESKIYELIATQHILDLAPRYFGLFKDKSRLILILSYEGHSFDSFKSLSIFDRCVSLLFSIES